jgi:hypothetical protein
MPGLAENENRFKLVSFTNGNDLDLCLYSSGYIPMA